MVTLLLCMASSIAACVFAGARLISSASTMLGKHRPLGELELAAAIRIFLRMSVPVMSMGIKSGCELNTAEAQAHRLARREPEASWPIPARP